MQIDAVHEIELADTRFRGGVGAGIHVPLSKVATSPEGADLGACARRPACHCDADDGRWWRSGPRPRFAASQSPSSSWSEVPATRSPTATHRAREVARHAVQVAALRGRRAHRKVERPRAMVIDLDDGVSMTASARRFISGSFADGATGSAARHGG